MKNPLFERKISGKKIESLKQSTLFNEKLKEDVERGTIFPAIRKNEMHFYYKGGNLFKFTSEFQTNIKFGFVPENSEKSVKESNIEKMKPVDSFVKGYSKIKNRCKSYSHNEALGVSAFYKHSAWNNKDKDDIVLLDIEAMFSKLKEEKDISSSDEKKGLYKHDRFDIVLYNKKTCELRVFEAKHFTNPELWNAPIPDVVEQVSRYENVIKEREKEIIFAYGNQIEIMNKIFHKNYAIPKSICKKVGLLVFGFDNDQKKRVNNQCISTELSFYSKGNIDDLKPGSLNKCFNSTS